MLAEIAMKTWGVDPVYIRENWTDELLLLMVEKAVKREKDQAEAMQKAMKKSKSARRR